MIDQMVSDSTLTNWYDKLNHHHVIEMPHTFRSEPSHVLRFLISNFKLEISVFNIYIRSILYEWEYRIAININIRQHHLI